MSQVRKVNLLSLFRTYAEGRIAAGALPRGLDSEFAEKLQISRSMWSQLKGSRTPGDKLARQIEHACGQPPGWLDEDHSGPTAPPTEAEAAFLALALEAYRSTTAEGRRTLRQLIHEVRAKRTVPG